MSTLSYNTGIQSFKITFTALSIVPWVKLSFAAFPWVRRYLRFWMIPVTDPRWSNSSEFRHLISLLMKSKQLFHILFCMRFSAMRVSTKVFEHAKITRWRHCNADSFKPLKANYMIIKLLCVYKMTKYVGKILLWNSKQLLRKLQKVLWG